MIVILLKYQKKLIIIKIYIVCMYVYKYIFILEMSTNVPSYFVIFIFLFYIFSQKHLLILLWFIIQVHFYLTQPLHQPRVQ